MGVSCVRITVFCILAVVLIVSVVVFKVYEGLITDLINSKPCDNCGTFSEDYPPKRICCSTIYSYCMVTKPYEYC